MMKEKSIPTKIVILVVILLLAGTAIWVSIGSSISALPQYSKNNVSGNVINAAAQRINEASTSCSSLQSTYADISDFLLVAEEEQMLEGDSLSLAWKQFRDKYMEPYLDCRLSLFRNNQWSKKDLDNTFSHLETWEKYCSLSSYGQIGIMRQISTDLREYDVGTEEYQDKETAAKIIRKSLTYLDHEYLKNCTTAKMYANNIRNSLSQSHMNQLEYYTAMLNKPNENFAYEYEFDDCIAKSLKKYQDYNDLVNEHLYTPGERDIERLSKAKTIINEAEYDN